MHYGKLQLTLAILFVLPCLLLAQPTFNLSPIPSSFDINSPNPVYALDVNYDDLDLDRQAFHLFLPDTMGSYPLVVYIHGGGFTGGTRDVVLANDARKADIKYFLEQGFAYASFGYRLLPTSGIDEEGVIKCLNDSKRALQYIRYFAEDFHINPDKVVLSGGSAGAGTSLWLATRSDMADPDSPDPVLRSSTRVCAAALSASQSTYDIYKWETQVYHDFDGQGTNFTLDSMANVLSFERFSSFYGGVDSTYQVIHDPELIQYRQDVDMLYHMSDDDPPIYFANNSGAVHPSQDLFHHSFHGREINNTALAAGLPEVKASIPAQGINTTQGESLNEFITRHLTNCSLTTSVDEVEELRSNEFKVYPNPAQNDVTVSSSTQLIESLELYSITGQLMQTRYNVKAQSATLLISDLPKGIYALLIVDGSGEQQLRKVIVQ